MIKKNIHTEKNISKAVSRLYTVQALFQMESDNITLEQVLSEFTNYRDKENHKLNNFVKADLALFRQILRKTIEKQSFIDQSIELLLKEGWPIERIDPILRSIFRAACSELLLGTPPKVVINEFLDIAKAFFPAGKQCQLANGVLDALAKNIMVKENS